MVAKRLTNMIKCTVFTVLLKLLLYIVIQLLKDYTLYADLSFSRF